MSLPLLLDTTAALLIAADAEIELAATAAMGDAWARQERVVISPISAFEIGAMARDGVFRSAMATQRWWDRLLATPGLALAPLTPGVFLSSLTLPDGLADDLGSRIVAATAREFGYTVVTRDPTLHAYAADGHLSVLAC